MSTILHIYLQFVYKTANTIHIGINMYTKYILLGYKLHTNYKKLYNLFSELYNL